MMLEMDGKNSMFARPCSNIRFADLNVGEVSRA